MKISFRLIFCGALLGSLAACSSNNPVSDSPPIDNGVGPKGTPKSLLEMARFSSCGDFRNYLAEALFQEYTTGFWAGQPCWSCEDAVFISEGAPPLVALPAQPQPQPTSAPTAGEEAQFDAGAGAAPDDGRRVNDTNTQEEGVDEADLVESNAAGTVMYFVSGGRFSNTAEVLVFDTSDAENTTIIARIPINNQRFVRGLYLDEANNRLTVVTEAGYFIALPARSDAAFAPEPGGFQQGSELLAFDVSDPANPVEIGRFTTDAQFIDSRRTGTRVHLVSQFGIPLPTELQQDEDFNRLVYDDYARALRDADEERQAELRQQIRTRIDDAVARQDLSALLPRNNDQPLACEDIFKPEVPQRLGLMQVTSVDTDTANPQTVGLLNNGWLVYGSQNNIYIAQSSGGWWFDPEQVQQTAVYRFEVSDAAAPVYRGSGLVDGWANNRYQYSEFAEHLRVVTEQRGPLATDIRRTGLRSQLHVLQLDATGMEVVGQTPTFAPDESIFSARFIGDRGFVVTFFCTDPLFAFDLSDPSDPQIKGELIIPGFSTYIHPLGPDHLLTIGRAGDAAGRCGTGNSFQLQVFNVAGAFDDDPATDLEQVVTAEPGLSRDEYAFSLAEHEPLAFNFLDRVDNPAAGVLSIPVQIGSPDRSRSFSGFFGYEIDANAGTIDEILRINHAIDDPNNGQGCPPRRTASGVDCASFAPVIYNEPLRTKIVEEPVALSTGLQSRRVFFSFSSAQLKIATPDTGPLGGDTDLGTVRYAEDGS